MQKSRLGVLLLAACLAPALVVCNEKVEPKPTAEAPVGASSAVAANSAAPDAASDAASPDGGALNVCSGTYALCTTAKCTPTSDGNYSCPCSVQVGASVGSSSSCVEAAPKVGLQVPSRYHPVKGFVACANGRTWAWCLDKKCTIESVGPDGGGTATCTCTPAQTPAGDYYVIVTDSPYTSATCTTDVWSSASVQQILQATGAYQGAKGTPQPMNILAIEPPPPPPK